MYIFVHFVLSVTERTVPNILRITYIFYPYRKKSTPTKPERISKSLHKHHYQRFPSSSHRGMTRKNAGTPPRSYRYTGPNHTAAWTRVFRRYKSKVLSSNAGLLEIRASLIFPVTALLYLSTCVCTFAEIG